MKVQEFLRSQNVAFQERHHPPAYTAQEIAAEEHVSGYNLAKAVVVKTPNGFVMCVLPASVMLDLRKVAAVLKVKETRLADEEEMARLFPDAEVGAEPPMGNLYDLPTIVDARLAQDDEIVFQGGTHRDAIGMKYADFARLAQPTVADIGTRM